MGINVLSLFDGISCGQVALQRAGIKIDNYYASEINKNSIQITIKNFPNTIHLGDVQNIVASNLPKIDIVMGGSPCQDLSKVKEGKGLHGKKSGLFYEFVRLLQELKPKYFLLENVIMKQEWQNIISNFLGVKPIMINSNLVSAQDRKRLYWTNIPNIQLPKDKGIILKNIIQDNTEVEQKYWYDKEDFVFHGVNKKVIATLGINGHDILKRVNNVDFKSPTLTACRGGNLQKKVYQIMSGIGGMCRKLTPIEYERLQTLPDNYTEGVADSHRYNGCGDGWTVDIVVEILRQVCFSAEK